MAHSSEREQILARAGIISDLPRAVIHREALARALINRGIQLANIALDEATAFADSVPLPDPDEPFSNMSPVAKQSYLGLHELVHVDIGLSRLPVPRSFAEMSSEDVIASGYVQQVTRDRKTPREP